MLISLTAVEADHPKMSLAQRFSIERLAICTPCTNAAAADSAALNLSRLQCFQIQNRVKIALLY